MNDIFVNMNVPELGNPKFQTQFTDFCNSIIENIQRLVSVQYTKGEPGNSVTTNKCVVKYTVNQDQWKLSNMGRRMVEKIFSQNPDAPQDWGWNGVNDRGILANTLSTPINTATIEVGGVAFVEEGVAPSIISKDDEGNIKEYNAIPDLLGDGNEDPTGINIEINVDPVKGEAFLASPYLFIDGRIEGLNRVFREHHDEDYYKTFHDFSVAVYGHATYTSSTGQLAGDPTTWGWEFELVNIVPKLYFDQEINEFCWEVNGQQTGITAQGIKGDDGITPNALICIGNESQGKLNISKILYIDADGRAHWALKNGSYLDDDSEQNQYMFLPQTTGTSPNVDTDTDPEDIPQPKDNDIAIVFYDDSTGGEAPDPYKRAYMGKVFVDDAQGAYVVIGYDEDRRCDVFQAINEHNFWNIMMSINNGDFASPRGIIIPAEPTMEWNDPGTPGKAHIMYAKHGSGDDAQDAEGYSKLCSTPAPSADTHGTQGSNPTRQRPGDWEVNYNMNVKGNMQVQGALGDASVQGDLHVQGTIQTSNITVTGLDWPTVIQNPKLACMSRFKDVYYVLNRKVVDSVSDGRNTWKIVYNLIITGTLELNIGMLSCCNDNTINDPHKALCGYGDYWSGTDGEINDEENRHEFSQTGSREKSKMYNVVTYNIPFSLIKTHEQNTGTPRKPSIAKGSINNNMWGLQGWVVSKTGSGNIWVGGDAGWEQGSIWEQAPLSIDDINKLSLRIGITGVNWKKYNGGQTERKGSSIEITNDLNGVFIHEILGVQSSGEPNMKETQGTSGAVQGLIKLKESHSEYADINKYGVHGKLYYAPLNDEVEINYAFDFFARVFEFNDSVWNKKTNTSDWTFTLKSIKYNSALTVTPVGCIQIRNQYDNKFHMIPIWPAVNIKDVGSSDIVLNQVEDVNSGGGSGSIVPRRSISGGITPITLVPANSIGNDSETTYKSILINPLINGSFSKTYTPNITDALTPVSGNSVDVTTLSVASNDDEDDDNPTTSLNGPIGNIIVGKNIESNYIMGIFDRKIGTPDLDDDYMEGKSCDNIKTTFFDLTPNMRVVSNNVKVCPNNVKDGTWNIVNNEAVWESAHEVPVVILPREGMIEGLALNGGLKIGVGNYQEAEDAPAISLKGVLMYPYTSCLVMINKTPSGDIIYNCIPDGADDSVENTSAPAQDREHAGHHYISSGRMMGVSNGEVAGMATRVNDEGTIINATDTTDNVPENTITTNTSNSENSGTSSGITRPDRPGFGSND